MIRFSRLTSVNVSVYIVTEFLLAVLGRVSGYKIMLWCVVHLVVNKYDFDVNYILLQKNEPQASNNIVHGCDYLFRIYL